jgi:ABC-2 type transport system ATP-binding protein
MRRKSNMANGIEVKNVSLNYEKFSLKNVSFNAPCGTVTGLIGRNGAGKSTLIKCIADCASYTGEITVNGTSADEDRVKYFSDLSLVFDELPYNDQVKIKQCTKIFEKIYPSFDKQFFYKMLERFKIELNMRITNLSFGTKKKFQLIAVMATKPQTLVLDEPTSGIDPVDRAEILNILQEFMMDENHTLLLSTHITSDLDKIADYITLIDNGQIVFSKSKDELQDEYRIIRAEKSVLSSEEMSRLIGIKENAFGVEGLTNSREIIIKQGINSAIPTVEEIMLAFTGKEKK